jgi:hypothetical protein
MTPRTFLVQVRTLGRAFLLRFFESEITSSPDDLKTSFFWLLAFLAVPGITIPLGMSFEWGLKAMLAGVEGLRVSSRGDKAFYLGFAMVASASLTAVTWGSLLIDRRDGLILGSLPVRPAVVVTAKLAALAAFIGLVSTAMHTLASICFGFFLASNGTMAFAFRSVLAHFLSALAASAFVLLTVTAVQGALLAALGPRLFGRVSSILQSILVGLIVAGLLALPMLDMSAVHTMAGSGPESRPWLLATPPLWFLGLYEFLLGAKDPMVLSLASASVVATAGVLAVTLLAYPLTYWRVMLAVSGDVRSGRRRSLSRVISGRVIGLVARRSDIRGVAQFVLATFGRSERHRFILAAAAGVAITWMLPTWSSVLASRPSGPTVPLLSLPLSTMLFVLAGVRVAIGVPADLRAGWLFDVNPPAAPFARAAIERMMIGLVVLPVVLITSPLYVWLWGPKIAILHGALSLAIGVLLTEIVLGRVEGMPCARRWEPETLNLGKRWFVYLIGFLVFTKGIPRLEILLFDYPRATICSAFLFVVVAAAHRYRLLRRSGSDAGEADVTSAGELLGLN